MQFRFVDGKDKALLVLAVIGSCLYGIVSPAQYIVFGSLTDDFVDYTLWTLNVTKYICSNTTGKYICDNLTSEPDLEDSMTTIAYWFIGIAVANFSFAWLGLGMFGLVAQRQAYKMRLAMFRSAIYQEIGWFDAHSSGELNVNLSEYVEHFVRLISTQENKHGTGPDRNKIKPAHGHSVPIFCSSLNL